MAEQTAAPRAATIDEQMREFAELKARKKALEAELRDVNERTEELKPTLLEHWAQNGWKTGPRIAGLGLLYLHRQGWARLAGHDSQDPDDVKLQRRFEAIAALKAAGLRDYVPEAIGWQKLSGHLRSLEPDERELLLGELGGVIEFETEYDLRLRR